MPSHYARPVHERFRPVRLRARVDGWTEARQRGFVALLGEGRSTAEAARAVGMTERSANRLRARAGAASFAKAWDTAVALARPVPEAKRPWRVKRHRWRGRVVHAQVVWDEVAVRRVLASSDLYGVDARPRHDDHDGVVPCDLSYTDGAERQEHPVRFRTFQQAHRAREREKAVAAHADAWAEALATARAQIIQRRRARADWAGASLQFVAQPLVNVLPHRSRQGRPSRSRPPHGRFGVPAARTTGPP